MLVGFIGFAITASALADIQIRREMITARRENSDAVLVIFFLLRPSCPTALTTINKTEGNSAAASYGVVRGLGRSTARHFTGLFEMFTFAAPVHHNSYRPVLPTTFPGSMAAIPSSPPELGSNRNTSNCRDILSQPSCDCLPRRSLSTAIALREGWFANRRIDLV